MVDYELDGSGTRVDPGVDPRVAAYVAVSGRDVFPVDDTRLTTPALHALWCWWRDAATEGVPRRDRFDIAEPIPGPTTQAMQ